MVFEISIPPLTGQITKAELYEVDGVTPPKNAIKASQKWGIDTEWQLCGYLATLLPGNWKLELLLEKMGPGAEIIGPPGGMFVAIADGTPCPTAPDCICWAKKVEVLPGQVAPGTYHVVLSLTWKPSAGTEGPIVGFSDMGLVRIY